MYLKDIVDNSNYITDESLSEINILGVANNCIAELNTKIGTNLPQFITGNLDSIDYNAVSDDWQLRLLDPYFAFAIMANDDNDNTRDFHYQRFLNALVDFKKTGIKDIVTIDESGEETGYAGGSSRYANIDPSERAVIFQRW